MRAFAILVLLPLSACGPNPNPDPSDPLKQWEDAAEYIERGIQVAQAVIPLLPLDDEQREMVSRALVLADKALVEYRAVLALVRAGQAPERDLAKLRRLAYEALDGLIALLDEAGILAMESPAPEVREYWEWKQVPRP